MERVLNVFFIGLCVVLSACASPETLAQRKAGLTNMAGLPAATVYDIYGVPDKLTPSPDGSSVYTWRDTYSYVYQEAGTPTEVKNKTVAEKIGSTMLDNLFNRHHQGDVIAEECFMDVTIVNSKVLSARVTDESETSCDQFYDKWYRYQDSRKPQQ